MKKILNYIKIILYKWIEDDSESDFKRNFSKYARYYIK